MACVVQVYPTMAEDTSCVIHTACLSVLHGAPCMSFMVPFLSLKQQHCKGQMEAFWAHLLQTCCLVPCRYVILPKDFEKGYKANVKKSDADFDFYR